MSQADYRDRQFLAVIGDEDSVTGLLLAGIGVSFSGQRGRRMYLTFRQHVTTGPDSQKNFLVVDNKTDNATIESTFDKLIERKDIGIILINQHASYISFARKM
ncbi:hypothetical protein FJTKL_06281 [Diaporthe vaccinii]|uniref:V-type proton ATPase subunit F n=1 Tax=Diaporthe vaccinii TaxID=105482 RepID=A0ABR4DRB3_9PEZI